MSSRLTRKFWVKKGTYAGKGKLTGRVGKVSTKVKKYVKRAINADNELKYYTNNFSTGIPRPLLMSLTAAMVATTGITTAVGTFPINIMAQAAGASTSSTRLGDICRIKRFTVKLRLAACNPTTPFADSATHPSYYRVLIYIVRNPEGSPASAADFINNPTAIASAVDEPLLPNVKSTIKVLKDVRVFRLNVGNTNAPPDFELRQWTFNFKGNGLKTVFYPISQQATAAQDWRCIKKNAIACTIIAGPSDDATTPPTLSTTALSSITHSCEFYDA